MDRYNSESKVKPIHAYLKESIKFYELDKPMLARVIFLLELALLFGGYLFARPYTLTLFNSYELLTRQLKGDLTYDKMMSVLNSDIYANMLTSLFTVIFIYVAIKAVSFLVTLFFGAQYYFSLTNPEMSGAARSALFLSRLPKLIFFNILFYLAFFFGVFVMMIVFGIIVSIVSFLYFAVYLLPLLVMALSSLFVFKDLLIIEFDIGITKNFKKSFELTRSSKKNVIINMLWPFAIGWLLNVFALDVNNAALSIFISAFLEVITLLVTQRLTVLMFLDAASIERKDKRRKAADTIV